MRAAFVVPLLVAACAPQPAPVAYATPSALPIAPAVCQLPVRHHSHDFNVQLADELDSLGKGSAADVVVAEHVTLQDAAENACDAASGRPLRHMQPKQ
jgi:hypothetical protein